MYDVIVLGLSFGLKLSLIFLYASVGASGLLDLLQKGG
jgi:hypothetical protein